MTSETETAGDRKGDRHDEADRVIGSRVPAELKETARLALEARGRTMRDYLTAALAALVADPDAVLAGLAPHWPEPKPYGRPRRS